MIKLDPTKIYYLSHPCTSVGTMAENKWHEQECVDAILLSQEGYVCRDHHGDNKIKLVRPLTVIPEYLPEEKSKGCKSELGQAKNWGLEVLYYEQVVKRPLEE